MPITVFKAPFAYEGTTKELLTYAREIVPGPDYSSMLYLAPTQLKVQDAERIFQAIAGDCYIPPAMMTIRQLSNRTFSTFDDRKMMPGVLIPILLSRLSDKSLGYSHLIADFINEIKQHYPGQNMESVGRHIISVFDQLGIPGEVSARASEATHMMNRYHETLKKCHAADENDAMAMFPFIARRRLMRYECLVIDGFIELTPSEEAVVKALIEHTRYTLISMPNEYNYGLIINRYNSFLNNNFIFETVWLPCQKKDLSFAYISYPDVIREVEGIARSIKNHFINGTVRDLESVFVVFPDLNKYRPMISRIFGKYGIPFTITSEKSLAETKPYQDIIALLYSVSNDYPRLQFAQFLTSPYFKSLPDSLRKYIPSICISSSFIKGKNSWLNLLKSIHNTSRAVPLSRQEYRIADRALKQVFKTLDHLESIRNRASFTEYSSAVIKLLRDLDFDDSVNHASDRKERFLRIINNLSLADSYSDSALPNLSHFTDALKYCLKNTDSAETDTQGVRIVRFSDLLGLEPCHLYFGGLRDGDFPLKPDIDHIIPDSARKELSLVHLEKYLMLQEILFRKAVSSAKHYYLSYATMEGDRLFLPSSVLSWNEVRTEFVSGIFSQEEYLVSKRDAGFSSMISEVQATHERIVKKLFGEHTALRVTDIDAYRSCPRRFFIERVLSLKPLDIVRFEMEAVTLGTVVHEIMQKLLTTQFTDIESLTLNAGEIIDAVLSVKSIESFWKKVIKDAFLSSLPHIYKLEQQINNDGYRFARAEIPVKGEILPGVTLKGTIDRIDFKNGEHQSQPGSQIDTGSELTAMSSDMPVIEIIDYKTSAIQFTGKQIRSHGMPLQLFLYAALIQSMGMRVERVGLYSLKDFIVAFIPNRLDSKNGLTIKEYISSALHFLGKTVPELRQGVFPAQPTFEQTCRNCFERPYCPYIQRTGR